MGKDGEMDVDSGGIAFEDFKIYPVRWGSMTGNGTDILGRHAFAQTHRYECASCHMRCQQLILRAHLSGFGSSALLFCDPIPRPTNEFT